MEENENRRDFLVIGILITLIIITIFAGYYILTNPPLAIKLGHFFLKKISGDRIR